MEVEKLMVPERTVEQLELDRLALWALVEPAVDAMSPFTIVVVAGHMLAHAAKRSGVSIDEVLEACDGSIEFWESEGVG
jgi:hypothetical protein